ncbi:DUF4435 domain-containing protein [Herbaspirillum sp. ST 5-3]|uniref:DUF4435 domain-containing protein n=1 Tax=Oxalobacteraceae TaxID=75682 RepID=UPI0010A3C716|nr:DUF4435 domain-containing protein [Herbaspirillum sp. ST 5-3]
MKQGSKVEMTIDEIIATLVHSSLPTLIIEGSDDVIVYRRMEDVFSDIELSVMSVGGRENVLKIFQRIGDFKSHKKIAFIADRDTWLHTGVPASFISECMFITDGYSIENDIYRDGSLEKLLTKEEEEKFRNEIAQFIRWYALSLSRLLSGQPSSIDLYPGIILDDVEQYAVRTQLELGEMYPEELVTTLMQDYAKLVRGKSLFAVLGRQISYKRRRPRVHHEALLEVHSAAPGPLLQKLYMSVAQFFGCEAPPIT